MKTHLVLLVPIIVSLFVIAAAAAGAKHDGLPLTTFEKSVDASGVRSVEVRWAVGAINIVPDSPDVIHVTAKGSDIKETDFTVTREGSAVVIKSTKEDTNISSYGNKRGPYVHIHIPKRLAVTADIGIGSFNLTGEVRDVETSVGTGEVAFTQVECSGHSVKVVVNIGQASLQLHSLPDRSLSAEIGTGQLDVGIPAGSKASVKMATKMGDLTANFPMTSKRSVSAITAIALSGDMNGGGTTLDLKVGTGDLALGPYNNKSNAVADADDN